MRGFQGLDLKRAVVGMRSLERVPLINLLDDPLLVDALVSRGVVVARMRAADPSGLRLRPGDSLYVPVVDPARMEAYRKRGSFPKDKQISVVRYTWTARRKDEVKRENKELYPWTGSGTARTKPSLPGVDPRLRSLADRESVTAIPVLDPGKVFFTADTHFSDSRVLRFRRRFPDLASMDAALVRNWNATVPPDGVVFHLGDLMYGGIEQVVGMLGRLNGTILLVKGNHDDIALYRSAQVASQTRLVPVGTQRTVTVGGRRILLNHYPFLCYAGQYGGVWQLFGHVHSGRGVEGFDLPRLANLLPFQYDVGVDNNDDAPVPFSRLEVLMSRRAAFDFVTVRPAVESDIGPVKRIAGEVIGIMREHGNTGEWDDDTFSEDVLRSDIGSGFGFTILERDVVAGYFAAIPGGDGSIPVRDTVTWLEPDRPFFQLERIVGLPRMHGVVQAVYGHCASRMDNIRLVTSSANVPMRRAVRKHWFTECGSYVRDDGTEMVAFQKVIQK